MTQNLITAGTSTSPGIQYTGGNDGTIAIQSGSTPTTAITVDASQNVGIGTTSPANKLNVSGAFGSSNGIGMTATGGASNASFLLDSSSGNGYGSYVKYKSNTTGGTTNTWVVGTNITGGTTAFEWYSSGSSSAMKLDSGGNLVITAGMTSGTYAASAMSSGSGSNVVINLGSGTFYYSTSALKYKTNIRDLPSIDISKFRPVVYNSTCDSDDKTIDYFGFIADEVDEAGYKQLVNYKDGKVEGFQYERMTVVVTKAIQELSAQVTALQAQVTALTPKSS